MKSYMRNSTTVCPAASRAAFACSKALVTGGSGFTIPSSIRNPGESEIIHSSFVRAYLSGSYLPKQSFSGMSGVRHGIGKQSGSARRCGWLSTTVLHHISMSSKECAISPTVFRTASWPLRLSWMTEVGNRPKDGFSE
jgi:hypothetical protein